MRIRPFSQIIKVASVLNPINDARYSHIKAWRWSPLLFSRYSRIRGTLVLVCGVYGVLRILESLRTCGRVAHSVGALRTSNHYVPTAPHTEYLNARRFSIITYSIFSLWLSFNWVKILTTSSLRTVVGNLNSDPANSKSSPNWEEVFLKILSFHPPRTIQL